MDRSRFSPEYLKMTNPLFFAEAQRARSVDSLRERLSELVSRIEFDSFHDYTRFDEGSIERVRDCATAMRSILRKRSDDLTGFSVAKAIRDISRNRPRPDLSPGFYAELLHIILGIQGRGPGRTIIDLHLNSSHLSGREAARERSAQLDLLWKDVERRFARYSSGLEPSAKKRRAARRDGILEILGGSRTDWEDWRWHVRNVVKDVDLLGRLVTLSEAEKEAVAAARRRRLPFGITPYYLSLMDNDDPGVRDASIRAQVIPSLEYVEKMSEMRGRDSSCLDFMREEDTSPCELITRRYPAICILKPFNTCPQICVYCQRNWEINDAMAKGAYAGERKIDAALRWIEEHPAVHEVLVTGGDPLAMTDDVLGRILKKISRIESIERIRIGSRTPVTIPMRITEALVDLLASLRKPGRREIVLVTHIQHSSEITEDVVHAVARLRDRGIAVYNQLVFTFYASRRFEAAFLRRNLRLAGIDPYYTFNTKGKEETAAYRVPIARLLQEQKEEARLLPGMERTDEAVFNIPGLGKNYIRARQHREILSVLPDGSRIYEFHPWEKNISNSRPASYIFQDIPIIEYLERLETVVEDPGDYETIWYYF